jgi:hypothetical protein
MNSNAEDEVPSQSALWTEIRRVNALLERRIAEQMAAIWRSGRARVASAASTDSSAARANQDEASNSTPRNGDDCPA